MKMLIVNGPNLNLIGKREPDIYGSVGLESLMKKVVERGKRLDVSIDFYQSNEEGALVTRIGDAIDRYDGIIINPAAYTHTSVALRDALMACKIPCVEVHLSNIYSREEFRRKSLTAAACIGQICGFGGMSYILGLEALVSYVKGKKNRSTKK